MMNEEIRLPGTLMVKDIWYTMSAEERSKLTNVASSLLLDYGYRYTEGGLNVIFNEWASKKGWLIDLFSKHPNYNGNFQIVLPSTLRRPVDMEGVRNFIVWAKTAVRKQIPELRIGMFTVVEYLEMRDEVAKIADSFNYFPGRGKYILYRGKTKQEWQREKDRMEEVIYNAKHKVGGYWNSIFVGDKEMKISREDYRRLQAFDEIIDQLLDRCYRKEEPNIISQADKDYLSSYAEILGIPMVAGNRVAKYVRKLLVKFGADKIVDLHERSWTTTDENGNTVQNTRMEDLGYNHYFALLGDSINPVDIPCELVISVNPIDFWTMSFGYKWGSCHTLDKENRRNCDNSYHGCYSSGTTSYMLDGATFIVYSRPSAKQLEKIGEDGLPMELQSKMKRCVFYLGEDKLVQSRLYPDGRDGGDAGLAAQFRNIVQDVIAKLYDTANLWVLKKGTCECSSVVDAGRGATNYPDYENYDDCNVSYLRRVDGLLNARVITVGTAPICPVCGKEHSSQEWIICDNCRDTVYCENCGELVSRRDAIYVDGEWYCDADCANSAGYVETEDDGWHHRRDCGYESYTDTWYYYTDEAIVTTDDEWFHNGEAAEDCGYVYCEYDDEWSPEDDAYEIGDTGEFFNCQYHDYIEAENGMYFPDADTAENNGYHRLEDGAWTNEEVA